MFHGRPSSGQLAAIQRHVQGKVVHDLGAGPVLEMAHELLNQGANYVFAIDREAMELPRSSRIRREHVAFQDYEKRNPKIDVAFVCWPQNILSYPLQRLCFNAKTVIYLGKNTDGTCCGHPVMFKDFLYRELLEYVPHRMNTLCIYGEHSKTPRKPKPEEFAGIYTDRIYHYSDLEVP